MTDKELLELAAKAAGYSIEWFGRREWCKDRKGYFDSTDSNNGEFIFNNLNWNPLTDDGDALRLAVKLKIQYKQVIDFVVANVGYDGEVRELVKGDPYAATRRAIVRAAAEIGKPSDFKIT